MKQSIKILEYAVSVLEEKSNEGLRNLSLIRKPDNVIHLKYLGGTDEISKNTLMACQRIPSIILLSLMIEQTLKLLILQETGKEYRIHELKKLLEKLPVEFCNKIKQEVMIDLNIDLQSFNEKLSENSNVFIDWRYFYETHPNTANSGFLHSFYKRLKDKIV